ncbi:LOW QUALITY PROTEIN: A-kinase anchor protein 12-like [Pristis pectinata]|uniref:LOW QUALITY PROTEIN: A-kinase anchor protein 12-like n=1 Tax=Pristis pectinata TaxID=685728 RepID=UPI00223E8CF3|nr:LOW QUALITY PROTEIN: A-kinase anchor protein 12-like [Pristis pectinata]
MGAGTSVQEPARPGPPDSPGEEEKKSQQEAGDQHPAGGAGDKSVQKNGQISGIQGDAEDPKALDSKSEQLNGIQEEVVAREVGQGDPAVVSGGEETEEMELNEKEVPVENEGGEQKDAQEGDELPTETGEPAEEVQAAEIGFKKVFKFVGLKFTMKKEKPVKSEPVQLLTVTREEGGVAGEEGGVAGEVASESKQHMEGSIEANASPTDEAEGSPPEILSPEKTESVLGGRKKPKCWTRREVPAAAESGANAAESPAVESPLKRFFRQGFFLGLRRKQSFKKAKDEPLVIGEKTETNGERAGDAGSEVTERGPEAQPSTSQEAAEVLTVQSPEEHGGEEEDFEDLTAELADVMVASEAPTVAESRTPEVKENGAPAEQSLVATDLGMGQQIPSSGKSPEGQAGVESPAPEASAELQAEHEEGAQEQPSVTNSEPVSDEGEFVASQRPKQQDSPLKKLFTSSSIKKLSAKKAKGKREETRAGDVDDEAKLQSSTESEGSPDSNKPDSPPAFPEEVGEGILAEVTESGHCPRAEQEEANGAGDGERKKEPITAWASFKKLVTPRKRPKGPPESERDDEPTDKAKSATLSSAESTASEKQEEPKSNGEEVKLERSTEDPKKKADAPVTWEALICVGSSKEEDEKGIGLRTSKVKRRGQGSEANGQVQEHAEEQGGTSPECAESPVEGEASDGVISTWESFKRLVTPRRKSRSKLEERGEEFVPSPEAALPEAEPAKEESWVSLKKLIPGRRKKRSDIKPEQLQAESAGKDVAWAEITDSKSEEESSETPAVVPLSEYDAVDNEREHEQRLKAGTDAVQVADGVLATSEAPQPGGLGVGQTSAGERGPLEAMKSSVDERSPSWISAAVSDVIEEEVEDKTGLAEETLAVQKQEVLVGEPTPEEGVRDLSPDEVAEEAQEVVPKVVATSDYPVEESFTEETTEMVSAVSQLTETPVTTAEGTPVREDEALVSRQTREVLEEVRAESEAVGRSDRVLLPDGGSAWHTR